MRRRGGSLGLIVALALLSAMAGGTRTHAADEPSFIVVFDGSGSMWGNIEGTRVNKLTVARDALRRGLAKVAPQTRVGLASYGHRRGDCGDVEVMLPPQPVDVDRIAAPLEKLNPRGRGPLTLALQEAAKVLAGSAGRSSLILVHDDADNCQANLCAVATELRAAGIAVHVVGLGLKPEDASKMQCLPQTTGGRFFNAQTAEQVDPAIEGALRLASIGAEYGLPPPAASAPPPRPIASGPAPTVAQDAPAGLYLRALLAPKTEPVGWPLRWIVSPEGAPTTVLFDAQASNPYVRAAPGRYVVEARDGATSATATVDVVENGPTLANVVLNGGTLQVRGQAQKTAAPLVDAIITISSAGQDAKKETAGPPLAVFKGSEGTATLPAGRYIVRVEQGLVRTERSVVVPAGSQGRIDIQLNGALVQLTAAGRDGNLLDAPIFSVFEDDPDSPRGRREIARSAARQADFVLAPGTYYVNARQGSAEAQERVAVGPGDVVRRTLSLAASKLSLSTRPLGGTQLNAPVSYRVDRIDGSPGDAITTSRASSDLYLPSGRYRVEGRYGVMNARLVREVDVKAGQAQQVVFEHQASTVRLRLLGASGLPLGEAFWDIRDQSGRTVWTTGQSEPTLTLQAGRYLIRAETREKRYERALDLGSGETKVVEMTAD
jgi:Ca-activated chloride channel homolog